MPAKVGCDLTLLESGKAIAHLVVNLVMFVEEIPATSVDIVRVFSGCIPQLIDELDAADDGHEQVVEIVCNASSQDCQALALLRFALSDFGLTALLFLLDSARVINQRNKDRREVVQAVRRNGKPNGVKQISSIEPYQRKLDLARCGAGE